VRVDRRTRRIAVAGAILALVIVVLAGWTLARADSARVARVTVDLSLGCRNPNPLYVFGEEWLPNDSVVVPSDWGAATPGTFRRTSSKLGTFVADRGGQITFYAKGRTVFFGDCVIPSPIATP
jgi:hypothetical protein